MRNNKRKVLLVVTLSLVCALILVGAYAVRAGKAGAPGVTSIKSTSQVENPRPTGELQPAPLGFAPYAYVAHGGIAMPDYSSATGAKQFMAAFVLGSGCTPLWDGDPSLTLTGARSRDIQSQIQSIKAGKGSVAISFGGQKGTELANSCNDVPKLQAAYQSVIDRFSVRQINFDLEGMNETDPTAMSRRVQALTALEQANPGLRVSLTLPVSPSGFNAGGIDALKQFHAGKVTLSNIYIMAMNFGHSNDAESGRVIAAIQAATGQIQKLYPELSTTQVRQGLGVVVMAGFNDVADEIFTLADAQAVRSFAAKQGIGTLSLWSASRDVACDTKAVLSSRCSGVSQSDYDFGKILATH